MKKNKKLIISLIVVVGILLFIGAGYFIFISTEFGCDSNNEVTVGEDTNITVHCGDTVIVELEYCLTCGYEPWEPIYNEKAFELVSYKDKEKAHEEGLFGYPYIRTYIFRAKKIAINSVIQLGDYRSFDAEDTWRIVKNLRITVL